MHPVAGASGLTPGLLGPHRAHSPPDAGDRAERMGLSRRRALAQRQQR